MPTIKKKHIGDKQFGGFTPYGNLTTYRATLQTNAAGAVINADSTAPVAAGDQIVLELLPEGYLLEDAQLIVSIGMTATITGSLGFEARPYSFTSGSRAGRTPTMSITT